MGLRGSCVQAFGSLKLNHMYLRAQHTSMLTPELVSRTQSHTHTHVRFVAYNQSPNNNKFHTVILD